jgi:hypothetical protein
MKTLFLILGLGVMAGGACAGTPDVYHSFDNYDVGTKFTTATNGWQASTDTAYVTNGSSAYSGNSVVMNNAVVLTNKLDADSGLVLWTDFRIKPTAGRVQDNPSTNDSSFHAYFNFEGYLALASGSGWQVYSNDIWGVAIPPATNGYVRLSVYQNYGSSTQAVFLDERLIAQDLRFVGSVTAFSNLVLQSDNGCSSWLDDVRVTTNLASVGLSSNLNADAMYDALEVQTYGHAMRTLHVVAAAQPGPYFTTLQAALNAWRPRDIISIDSGSQAGEAVTISGANMVITGNALSLAGMTVASGASVTFSQTVYCAGALAVTGQMTMASGAVLTSATATVTGTLTLQGGTLQAGSLAITGGGQVNGTATHLVVAPVGVDMTTTFSLTPANWAAAVRMPLPFDDTFDAYATNTIVTNLNFRGWYASDGSVKVQNGTARSGNAVVLPGATLLSNSLSAAGTPKIWTDFYIQPVLGTPPVSPETNDSCFLAYVNTNGYLVVAVAGGDWYVCSNNAVVMQTNRFSRVTVMQEWAHHTFAVFVDSNLVAQGLTAPAILPEYKSTVVKNPDSSSVYVDDVHVTTSVPGGTSDSNGNNIPDAVEINFYDYARLPPAGTVFKIR